MMLMPTSAYTVSYINGSLSGQALWTNKNESESSFVRKYNFVYVSICDYSLVAQRFTFSQTVGKVNLKYR